MGHGRQPHPQDHRRAIRLIPSAGLPNRESAARHVGDALSGDTSRQTRKRVPQWGFQLDLDRDRQQSGSHRNPDRNGAQRARLTVAPQLRPKIRLSLEVCQSWQQLDHAQMQPAKRLSKCLPRIPSQARSSCIGQLLTRLGKRLKRRSPRPDSPSRNLRNRHVPVGSRPNWRVRLGSACRLVPSELGGQARDFAVSLTDLLNDRQFYKTQLRASGQDRRAAPRARRPRRRCLNERKRFSLQ